MIYVKGHKEEGPVDVVGGNPETNELHVILPNGQFQTWAINLFSADDGFKEIARTAAEEQNKYTKLWKWWKESCEKNKAANPDSIFHHLDNKGIEKECLAIPGFCWEMAKARLEQLYIEKGEKDAG